MQGSPLKLFFSFQRLTFFILSLVLLSACSLLPRDYISHTVTSNTLIINSQNGQVTYKALPGDAIEVLYNSDIKQLPSFSKQENLNTVSAYTVESSTAVTLRNGDLTLVVSKHDLSASFYNKDKLLTTQTSFVDLPKNKGFNFILDDTEKLLGGGERVLGMDRRGHRMPLYNKAHYGYSTESNQMNFGLPMVMSNKKYAVLFDNSASGFLDIGKTDKNTLSFEAVGGRTSYIVFAGDTYPELIKNYVDVTGKQPLPPRWALGNFASRFGYRTEQEVRDTVEKFTSEDFPLDALILDLYWFGPDIKGHMGNLDWDTDTFPTPVKMMEDLKEKDIKTILISEPFILNTSTKWDEAVQKGILAKTADGKPYVYDFYFGTTGLIDIFNETSQEWLSGIYQDLFNQGVSGTWGDLGEPEVHPDDMIHFLSDTNQYARGDEIHNVYGHEWARVVYQNQLKLQPETRPFLIMRSGFAGSQRYGMIPWTGDVSRSWGGLKPQVELSLQMGMMGMGYTHSDLGGFAGGEVFDQEMYIRWLQYGVFQPIYRPHAQDNIAPEPVFHDEITKNITREFIKLRYQLLPYTYTMAYQNATTGMPLMRPLFFADESNNALFDNKTAYLWGDAFLVSPITSANIKEQAVTVPKGVWFDYWTDTPYVGGAEVTVPVSLENIPVLVKAGAFVPMIESINNTNDYSSKQLTVHYYADTSVTTSKGQMYEDDGKTQGAIKHGAYDLLNFSATNTTAALSFDFNKEGGGYKSAPTTRDVTLVLHNMTTLPKRVLLDNVVLNESQYSFDLQSRLLTILFNWKGEATALKVIK
jgi:oligosaccharide 4-alpha-D-glucosyltransferase